MQWEYKVIHFRKSDFFSAKLDFTAIQERLNELGRDGWELASFNIPGMGMVNGGVAILKRLIK